MLHIDSVNSQVNIDSVNMPYSGSMVSDMRLKALAVGSALLARTACDQTRDYRDQVVPPPIQTVLTRKAICRYEDLDLVAAIQALEAARRTPGPAAGDRKRQASRPRLLGIGLLSNVRTRPYRPSDGRPSTDPRCGILIPRLPGWLDFRPRHDDDGRRL